MLGQALQRNLKNSNSTCNVKEMNNSLSNHCYVHHRQSHVQSERPTVSLGPAIPFCLWLSGLPDPACFPIYPLHTEIQFSFQGPAHPSLLYKALHNNAATKMSYLLWTLRCIYVCPEVLNWLMPVFLHQATSEGSYCLTVRVSQESRRKSSCAGRRLARKISRATGLALNCEVSFDPLS